MKKILKVTLLIFLMLIISGCGKSKTAETLVPVSKDKGVEKVINASIEHSCSCVTKKEDLDGLLDLRNTISKKELAVVYELMVEHGKILVIKENTKVSCYYAEEYRGYVPVVFFEGEYKGRRAYVPEKRLE